MIGAIAGDIIGSIYEHHTHKSVDFELFHSRCSFTDDTVMTIATAESLLGDRDFGSAYHRWGNRHRRAGYGRKFREWLVSDGSKPYNSWGNGSAMRVTPVAWVATSEEAVLSLAEQTALPTHNHPRGVVGAQAVALAVWLARQGKDREAIRRRVAAISGYDLDRDVDEIRGGYKFDVSCDGSVPEAIICALASTDWEHAVRLAISLGGDADTQAAIAGGIAEAMYGGVPADIWSTASAMLDEEMLEVVGRFGGSG